MQALRSGALYSLNFSDDIPMNFQVNPRRRKISSNRCFCSAKKSSPKGNSFMKKLDGYRAIALKSGEISEWKVLPTSALISAS